MGYTGKPVLEHFGHLRPDHITAETCETYRALRTERDKCSVGTVHTELGHLRSALRYAVKVGMITTAPHIWRPAKPMPKERYLSHEEIAALIEAANSPHIRLAITLLLGTAGRVGAILDLEWDRVDFGLGVINLRLPDAATRKGRAVVPMNGMTRAALSVAHDAALTDFVVEYAGDRVKSIRKGFHNACERAGLEDVTIHTLRHSAAVHMVSAGVPMQKVSQYLGHSNTAITERVYARYAPSHMQDAADVLNFTNIKKARG
ncbi:tyrosine-type recombinase/integrase [Sulfitobacter mediterraneus]